MHRVKVTTDLEAFLMITMTRKDCDILRFLWFDVFSDQPNLPKLRFTQMVFGVSSTPSF